MAHCLRTERIVGSGIFFIDRENKDMSGKMDCFGATHIGQKRDANEDQFMISDISKSMRVHQTSLSLSHHTRLFGDTQGKLLLVADGIGGHEAGERASQLVIDGIVDYTLNRLHWFMFGDCSTNESFEDELKKALVDCQVRIDREVAAIPSHRGMGSTLTMGYIVWPKLFIVHVGDCRCYLLRNGSLKQLTRDHTLADLVSRSEKGEMDLDETVNESSNDFSNVLWNAIGGGGGQVPRPDSMAMDLEMGDSLLLCSDGLNKHVSATQIKEYLSARTTAEQKCNALISAANDAGGSDNITVIVSCFLEQEKVETASSEVEMSDLVLPDTVDFENSPVIPAAHSSPTE